MLKKLVLGGVAVATFAGLGLSTPAGAAAPPPSDSASDSPSRQSDSQSDINAAEQDDNVIVCGNHLIGNLFVVLAPLTPVALADRTTVDCSIVVKQEN